MKKLGIILILFFLWLVTLTACTREKEIQKSFDQITEEYSELKNIVLEEGLKTAIKEETIEALSTNGIIELESESPFKFFRFYNIQGKALDDSGETLRDTIPYQRLMGHMDYYQYVEKIEDQAVLSSIIKMFDPDPSLIPMKFIGIIKLSVPLEEFIGKDLNGETIYILDSSKSILSLKDYSVITDLEERPELLELIKKLSLMEKEEGKIILEHSILSGSYFYRIEDGFVLLRKI